MRPSEIVRAFAARQERRHQAGAIAKSTLANVRNFVKHWTAHLERLGDPERLTRDAFESFTWWRLDAGDATWTISNACAFVAGAYRWAHEAGLDGVPALPRGFCRPAVSPTTRKPARCLTEHDVELLVKHSPPLYARLWQILAATGLRVRVRKSKTKAGVRTVPVPAEIVQAIGPRGEAGAFVFPSPNRAAKAVSQSQVRNVLRERAEACGISLEGLRPHAFRHTFASWCYESGASPREVQALLGHSTPFVSLQIYAHVRTERTTSIVALVAARVKRGAA